MVSLNLPATSSSAASQSVLAPVHVRKQQPIVEVDRFRQRRALRAQAAEIRRVVGIAAHRDVAVGRDFGKHAASDPAVGARRLDAARGGHVHVRPPDARLRLAGDVERAVLDLHRDRAHAPLVGALRFAAFERDHPVVQRARDRGAVHDALAERAALVRAVVVDGEDAIVGGAEHGHLAVRRVDAARAAPRNICDAADGNPVHRAHSAACAMPTAASGRNSCLCSPETRSDQGSTWANFCE